jgi:signal transduction histidine kinase
LAGASRPGRGSPRRGSGRSAPVPGGGAPSLRLLVVDDNPGDLRLIVEMLAEAAPGQWDVEDARSLAGALDKLSAAAYSAVVLDLGLDDCQGVETVARVWERAGDAALVVLTGLADDRVGMEAIQHGAQDFLVKGKTGAALLDRALRYSIQRKQLQTQLRETQKMETVGRLAGGIAHDFNNLLAIVLGHVDLLLRRGEAPEAAWHGIREIQKAAERAADLARQLLAFSRKQVLQPRLLDLSDLVRDIEGMLRRLIGETIELVTSLSRRTLLVKADPGQIDQVVLNLVINARDAMPAGGILTLRTDRVELDEADARAHGASPGRYAVLAVSDSGVGMDAPTRRRVFEPFFTTRELGRGAGLGLATVHGVVRQSGGFVLVDSHPGRGTTFQIFLPCVTASSS